MRFYFDAEGDCLGKTSGAVPEIPEIDTVLEGPDDLSPNDAWFDGNVVQIRTVVDLGIPDEIQVGNVVSFSIPANSRLYLNGALQPAGSFTLDTSAPGNGVLALKGESKYRKAFAILDAMHFEREAERAALINHPLVKATPTQIDNYIDNNVVDLDSARTVMKIIAKAAALALRK